MLLAWCSGVNWPNLRPFDVALARLFTYEVSCIEMVVSAEYLRLSTSMKMLGMHINRCVCGTNWQMLNYSRYASGIQINWIPP